MTTTIEELIAGREISESRLARLREAADLGATPEVLAQIRDAVRVSRTAYVMLPAHRYESLSRGRGWCRQGTGDGAVWADRDGDGYRVGPGRWTVGATDGFQRKSQAVWIVDHVQVGTATWTVARAA